MRESCNKHNYQESRLQFTLILFTYLFTSWVFLVFLIYPFWDFFILFYFNSVSLFDTSLGFYFAFNLYTLVV